MTHGIVGWMVEAIDKSWARSFWLEEMDGWGIGWIVWRNDKKNPCFTAEMLGLVCCVPKSFFCAAVILPHHLPSFPQFPRLQPDMNMRILNLSEEGLQRATEMLGRTVGVFSLRAIWTIYLPPLPSDIKCGYTVSVRGEINFLRILEQCWVLLLCYLFLSKYLCFSSVSLFLSQKRVTVYMRRIDIWEKKGLNGNMSLIPSWTAASWIYMYCMSSRCNKASQRDKVSYMHDDENGSAHQLWYDFFFQIHPIWLVWWQLLTGLEKGFSIDDMMQGNSRGNLLPLSSNVVYVYIHIQWFESCWLKRVTHSTLPSWNIMKLYSRCLLPLSTTFISIPTSEREWGKLCTASPQVIILLFPKVGTEQFAPILQ